MERTVEKDKPLPVVEVFRTDHYLVVIGMIDFKDTPRPLQRRYVVVHAEDGIVYGVAGGRGQAIVAALQAESELSQAQEIAEAQVARAANGEAPEMPPGFGSLH